MGSVKGQVLTVTRFVLPLQWQKTVEALKAITKSNINTELTTSRKVLISSMVFKIF